MEVKLDQRYVEAIQCGELRRDWKSIAKRVEHAEGRWQMVFTTKRFDRGLREEITDRLKAVGCIAQVVVGVPRNQHPLATPDRVVFARIPRSVRTPDGRLI